MYANSPKIESTQSEPHPRLRQVLDRHRHHAYQRPLAAHSRAAFEHMREWIGARDHVGLILDSGCGTGASTLGIAHAFPDYAVVGVDQSALRLQRSPYMPDNALLLRARLEDLWRVMLAKDLRPTRHFLWYPNPWPKPEHLMRRWHGHPVFPILLQLGGVLELRSNWRIYIDEFRLALESFGISSAIREVDATAEPATPFERKYRDSGHALWRLNANLSAPVAESRLTNELGC